jgi:UDP-N-acetylmuramoyl-tripeptide--D-alanyl-D-alanine ligase
MRSVSGRLVRRAAVQGAQLIDDTYNANPTSLAAALEVLAQLPGRHWLVLGDMGELGTESDEWHRRAGEWARSRGCERLYAVGPLSGQAVAAFGAGARHFESHGDLATALRGEIGPGVTVLIKGSRSMHMEQVVQALLAPTADAGTASGNH